MPLDILGALTFNLRVFGDFFAESTQLSVPFLPCFELVQRDVLVESYGFFKGFRGGLDYLGLLDPGDINCPTCGIDPELTH